MALAVLGSAMAFQVVVIVGQSWLLTRSIAAGILIMGVSSPGVLLAYVYLKTHRPEVALQCAVGLAVGSAGLAILITMFSIREESPTPRHARYNH